MTHTSTEQPYMPHATLHPAQEECLKLQARVAELHARVQELEASQAQRAPLSDRKIRQIDAHSGLDAIEFARAIERAHGITQEKQG